MYEAPVHRREEERLASLRSYGLLGTGRDPGLDAVAAAAAGLLDAPMSGVSVVGPSEQSFRGSAGVPVRVTPRRHALCSWVVHAERTQVVRDARQDRRFDANPLVHGPLGLRFYAGAPLIGRDGLPLGALCVLGREPRGLGRRGVAALEELARVAVEILELRRLDSQAGLPGGDLLSDARRLRRAIDEREVEVEYQPLVELASGRVRAVEALVRWRHPCQGLLPPSSFLPLAEATGLIVPLGRAVLEQACRQVVRWRDGPAPGLGLAVNVSGRQVVEPDLANVVTGALGKHGLPAGALTLELTETALVAPGDELPALAELRRGGVRLALDDFGTGFSSLAYLQRFEVDDVKLDRCFVAALGRSARSDTITGAAVSLALALGCDVVAEGVERGEQAQALLAAGVRTGQGYLYARPLPADEFERRLLRPAGWPSGVDVPALTRAT